MAVVATAKFCGYASPLPSTLNSSPNSTNLAPFALGSGLRPHRAAAALREVCGGRVPYHVLQRAEEVGYGVPTEVQEQSLTVLLSGQDCIPHAHVIKVARILVAKACTIMALLDDGMLRRQKRWAKAEPPAIIVVTVSSLCQMVEKRAFTLQSMSVLVIDEGEIS